MTQNDRLAVMVVRLSWSRLSQDVCLPSFMRVSHTQDTRRIRCGVVVMYDGLKSPPPLTLTLIGGGEVSRKTQSKKYVLSGILIRRRMRWKAGADIYDIQ